MAYGATEPEAGSDLAALRTTATRVDDGGTVAGYRHSGAKQWISNGGVADVYTILANAPGGPSWFVVERDTPGFGQGKPEDKHGIRAQQHRRARPRRRVRARRPPGRRSRGPGPAAGAGGVRLHAAHGGGLRPRRRLGSARPRHPVLDRARARPAGRSREKQGYTHKLIVPHVARLEAARAYIEETAARSRRATSGTLNTEGAIAKYLATEAGNAAADAAIQALGGYGYTREYMVEKIKRDVRITTIYEGTSEIMEMTIAATAGSST